MPSGSTWVLLLMLANPTFCYRTKYFVYSERLTAIREAVLAWQQDPESNSRPLEELFAVVRQLERDIGWLSSSERSLRKRHLVEILTNKLVELQTVTNPQALPEDFDRTLLDAIVELELLSYKPPSTRLFRLVIGW